MNTNASLADRRTAAVPRGVASATPIYADHASDSELWDVNGARYVDFAGGIAVLNVGHCHPTVIEAVKTQMHRFTHTAFQVVPYDCYIELAERLNAIAPIAGDTKTIFFTTGAEATENAIKIARATTRRSGVVAFSGGFHGRTLLASAMTGKVVPYKRGFGPMPGEVYHVPFPTLANGLSSDDSLQALRSLFAADLDPSQTAAIIIEPIQGEGGFHIAPPELLKGLRTLCDEHGILLVADEVQTGFARTGKMFGIEHSGINPDLITVAKSLAGGFPLSGVIGRADVMDAVEPGGLGGTFGGSPIACAAGLAVLDIIDQEHLLDRANAIGDRLRPRIEGFAGRNDLVPTAHLRGHGAMIGFDVIGDDGRADGAEAKRVVARALQGGLIVLTCGLHGETIRILVPLTASEAIVDEGLTMLENALSRATGDEA